MIDKAVADDPSLDAARTLLEQLPKRVASSPLPGSNISASAPSHCHARPPGTQPGRPASPSTRPASVRLPAPPSTRRRHGRTCLRRPRGFQDPPRALRAPAHSSERAEPPLRPKLPRALPLAIPTPRPEVTATGDAITAVARAITPVGDDASTTAATDIMWLLATTSRPLPSRAPGSPTFTSPLRARPVPLGAPPSPIRARRARRRSRRAPFPHRPAPRRRGAVDLRSYPSPPTASTVLPTEPSSSPPAPFVRAIAPSVWASARSRLPSAIVELPSAIVESCPTIPAESRSHLSVCATGPSGCPPRWSSSPTIVSDSPPRSVVYATEPSSLRSGALHLPSGGSDETDSAVGAPSPALPGEMAAPGGEPDRALGRDGCAPRGARRRDPRTSTGRGGELDRALGEMDTPLRAPSAALQEMDARGGKLDSAGDDFGAPVGVRSGARDDLDASVRVRSSVLHELDARADVFDALRRGEQRPGGATSGTDRAGLAARAGQSLRFRGPSGSHASRRTPPPTASSSAPSRAPG